MSGASRLAKFHAMNVSDAIRARRSIRKFLPREVSREQIETLQGWDRRVGSP